MNTTSRRFVLSALLSMLVLSVWLMTAQAQTTTFTYQGKLTESGMSLTTNYDMQFRLFDNPNAGSGTQQGATLTNPSVTATGGIFTVQLDFGAAVFAAGADLYLEVSVRPVGSAGGYQSLAPRQRLTSAPYAIRALKAGTADTATNATQLNGTAAGQFVQITDFRLTDARTPISGSSFYIQNSTLQQTGANFNIDGKGTLAALGIGTTTQTSGNIAFAGGAARLITVERTPAANSVGGSLSISAGGASSGATDKKGGDVQLAAGTGTGTGASGNVRIQTAGANAATGTTDNIFTDRVILCG